jgi:hypothetical protein
LHEQGVDVAAHREAERLEIARLASAPTPTGGVIIPPSGVPTFHR